MIFYYRFHQFWFKLLGNPTIIPEPPRELQKYDRLLKLEPDPMELKAMKKFYGKYKMDDIFAELLKYYDV